MKSFRQSVQIFLCIFLLFLACLLFAQDSSPETSDLSLSAGFAHPPDSAKPKTWWHWVSGNVTKEGITADLEAMKEIGLSGFQNFTVDQSSVKGPIQFMSPEWRDLVKFTENESHRLNLDMAMEGCDGWSESGGPWVPASESMQKVVWTLKGVHGGDHVTLKDLPQPETVQNFYQDIGFFAYPVSAATNPPPPKVTCSNAASPLEFAPLQDTTAKAKFAVTPEQPLWIQYEFSQPTRFGSIKQSDQHNGGKMGWQLQSSNDGTTYTKIIDLGENEIRSFPPVTARFFRLYKASLPAGVKEVTVTGFVLGPHVMDSLPAQTGISTRLGSTPFAPDPALDETKIDAKNIIDLSGLKEWQAPAGDWQVLRLGHTSTGATTHPSTSGGLECNKLSADAVEHHIEKMFGPLAEDSPERIGTTFKYILLDSWEAGCENWTDDMKTEFKARRGYDLTPWLPALAGQVIESTEMTQRFLWDYRRTLADLVAEKHYGTFQSWAHRHNMLLTSEASGIGMPTVADQLLCKKYTDIPMGEFWVNTSRDGNIDDAKEAASAAHIYGQNLAATESFTSVPGTAAWKNDPASLKALGDEEFCVGVNRFIFHRYAHQPWLDRVPGMSMGPWGINFERTNTWWKPGSAWISYLSRCQYLLQQGKFQADLLYFYGEGVPVCVRHGGLDPVPPAGYDYDVCNTDIVLNQLTFNQGRLYLPSGMSYRVLVLPKTDRMTLPVLKKIEELVHAGATVYGPKPLHSPSLSGYPGSEDELRKIADEVWGNCDGQKVTENTYGKGKIFWGAPLDKTAAVEPDFVHDTGDLLFIHRHTEGAEIYFLSNQQAQEITVNCTFRVNGKVPELWYPDTGKKETVAFYTTEDKHTSLPVHFDPTGSVFVIFKNPSEENRVTSLELNGTPVWKSDQKAPPTDPLHFHGQNIEFTAYESGKYVATTNRGHQLESTVGTIPAPQEITGSWALQFPPKLGAPDSATFDHLQSWTDSAVDGIKYFSGTAIYKKTMTLGKDQVGENKELFLDLGQVKNLAEVTLNGKNLGVLWKAPFRIKITDVAVAGANQVEIKLTNLWPNRLIGDARLPEKERVTWASVSLYKADAPLLPSGLLGPVKLISAQKVSLTP